jgi:hypothetical protein
MPGLHTAFFAASALLFTAGLVITLLALFRDRARGRARCPSCWYDMSGAPALTCPECGRTAKSTRQLRRTRRRWRRAAVGITMLLLAPASSATRFKIERWNALIPTTALVAAMAVLPHDAKAETTPPAPDDFRFGGGPATGSLSRVCVLFAARYSRNDIWGWQAALARRVVRWRVARGLADHIAIPREFEPFFGTPGLVP